jgi:hypothetical protein
MTRMESARALIRVIREIRGKNDSPCWKTVFMEIWEYENNPGDSGCVIQAGQSARRHPGRKAQGRGCRRLDRIRVANLV